MDNNLKPQPNVQRAVPFFMVMNMIHSLDFYINGLGFELKMKWEPRGSIEWCCLDKGGAALMLQEYRENNMPAENRGVGISICVMCNDALTIYKDAVTKGLSPAEPFVGNNLWVVEFTDPDGYKIFFESPTGLPEETRYSEWNGNA